jgi:Zn-dependent M28 family amino/carboxypeptidase
MYFYPWYFDNRPIPIGTSINIIVVCGFQQGTQQAGEWVVVGGHMDSVPQAIEGAYDDGSGTSAVLEVAQGLSQFKTRHTIVYCLWGGEEEGLYGSRMWVTHDLEAKVQLYINMDMAGLSWPAPYNFTAFVGPDEQESVAEHPKLVSLIENQTENELRYPRQGNFSVLEDPFGRSDHVSFWATGAPTVFFFGADDIEYPEYHSSADTMATMVRHAGDRQTLVAGFDTLVWMAFYLLVHADQEEFD